MGVRVLPVVGAALSFALRHFLALPTSRRAWRDRLILSEATLWCSRNEGKRLVGIARDEGRRRCFRWVCGATKTHLPAASGQELPEERVRGTKFEQRLGDLLQYQ